MDEQPLCVIWDCLGEWCTFGVDFRLHTSYASVLDSSVTTVDVEQSIIQRYTTTHKRHESYNAGDVSGVAS